MQLWGFIMSLWKQTAYLLFKLSLHSNMDIQVEVLFW